MFGACDLFDTQCVARGISDVDSLTIYGQEGTCECRNVEDCPRSVPSCKCPGPMFRVCDKCLQEFINITSGAPAFDDRAPDAMRLDPRFCSVNACAEWTCSCYDPTTGQGLAGSEPIINQIEGTAECPYECRADLDIVDNEQTLQLPGPPGQAETRTEYQCCGDYFNENQAVCLNWIYIFDIPYCIDLQLWSRTNEAGCLIEECCGEESGGGGGEGPMPGPGQLLCLPPRVLRDAWD